FRDTHRGAVDHAYGGFAGQDIDSLHSSTVAVSKQRLCVLQGVQVAVERSAELLAHLGGCPLRNESDLFDRGRVKELELPVRQIDAVQREGMDMRVQSQRRIEQLP